MPQGVATLQWIVTEDQLGGSHFFSRLVGCFALLAQLVRASGF